MEIRLTFLGVQRSTEKTSPQNKELLLLKQCYLKIGYADRTVSFNAFKQYFLLLYVAIENCALRNE